MLFEKERKKKKFFVKIDVLLISDRCRGRAEIPRNPESPRLPISDNPVTRYRVLNINDSANNASVVRRVASDSEFKIAISR